MIASIPCRRGSRLLPCAIAWSLAALAVAVAAAAPARAAVSVADLEAEIARLEGRAELDEVVRAQAVESYEAAVELLRRAQEDAGSAAEFERLLSAAPSMLEEIKADLDGPAPTLPAEIAEVEKLADAESGLAAAEAALTAARQAVGDVERERDQRTKRRTELPALLAEANEALVSVRAEIATAGATQPAGEVARAQLAFLQARESALQARAALLDKELASYDARRDLLTARLDHALRRVANAEEVVGAWRDAVSTLRQEVSVEATREAADARQAVAGVRPVLREIAEENAELAALRGGDPGVVVSTDAALQELERVRGRLTLVSERFAGVRRKAQTVGYTEAIGLLMRKHLADLSDLDRHRRAIRARQDEISRVQLALIDFGDRRSRLADTDALLDELFDDAQLAMTVDDEQTARAEGRELLATQREYLDALTRDYDSYFVALVDLDAADRELLREAGAYRSFINEHILWIRSTGALSPTAIVPATRAALWLIRPSNWTALLASAVSGVLTQPAPLLLWVLIASVLFYYQPRVRRKLREASPDRALVPDAFLRDVLADLGRTIVVALPWPVVVYLLAWVLDPGTTRESEFSRATSAALVDVAPVYLSSEFFRQLCMRRGVLEDHLRVATEAVRYVRGRISWAMVWALPLLCGALLFSHQGNDAWSDSLGRMLFCGVMAVVALFGWSLFHSAGPVVAAVAGLRRAAVSERLLRALGALAATPSLVLLVAAAVGYYYTAFSLTARVHATACLLASVMLAHAILARWLQLSQRAMAIAQRQGTDTKAADDAESVDLPALTGQAAQLLRMLAGATLAATLWFVWSETVPALSILDRVELWEVSAEVERPVVGDPAGALERVRETVPITLGNLTFAIIILLLAGLAGRNLPGFLQMILLQRLPLDSGMRYAVTSISRYIVALIGIIASFNAIGVSWSHIQWLAAAFTVGLGFGLQEIFANFVAGIIILFERPIRVGDTVTLGDVSGTVAQIRIRATTITDWDRKELIVPNKEFITGQLVNWSLSDDILRVVVPVGIAYGSDTELAEKLLLEAARECPHVRVEPAPSVIFNAFGDSSLDFILRVFISHIDQLWRTRHALHRTIDAKFRAAGVEIAFPQRDVHVRSIVDSLVPGGGVELVGSGAGGPDKKADS